MPPSRHENGRLYQWVPGHGPAEIEAAVAPAWVVEFMRADGTRQGRGGKAPPAAAGGVIPLYTRNTTLCSLAGTMRRRGMTEREILAALLVVNADRCEPPLDEGEVEEVARKICRYAPAKVSGAVNRGRGARRYQVLRCRTEVS
jgi:putative DNA primase/helicase